MQRNEVIDDGGIQDIALDFFRLKTDWIERIEKDINVSMDFDVKDELKSNDEDREPEEGPKQIWPRRIDEYNILWVPAQSVNPHLICGLCQGYLYEACTITECMHSFCKNCIVKHLQRSLNCPMCAILIHPTDPFVHIRLDGLLQDIVYALLPHVEKSELEKERLFYEKHAPELGYKEHKKEKKDHLTHDSKSQSLPTSYSAYRNTYIPPVSLCLQYLEPSETIQSKLQKQYIRVTGGATVRSLATFLKKKLLVGETQKVDLYCPCRTGFVSLSNSHTLKAVKDLYCYDQEILQLKFDVSEQ